jgi:hypothetical protein
VKSFSAAPVFELFSGLQVNSDSTVRTDKHDQHRPGIPHDEEFDEYVRGQILRPGATDQPTDDGDDPDLPSFDEIAAAMGTLRRTQVQIER